MPLIKNHDTREIHQFFIEAGSAGKRLDVWLSEILPGFSRSAVKHLIEKGAILVDGERAKVAHHLLSGQRVDFFEPQKEASVLTPVSLDLSILYEDEYLAAINKPPGIVVHPGAGADQPTIVHGLLYHFKNNLASMNNDVRPGIVHRLDKDTSGVLLIAKDDHTLHKLGDIFMQRQITKRYKAIAYGTPAAGKGIIDSPIGRHPVDRKKMSSKGKNRRDALSYWQVEENIGPITLFNIRIATGRTHQIRVHLAESNWPVVGDRVYGKNRRALSVSPKTLSSYLQKAPRQMLHASSIEFKHPVTDKDLFIDAPLAKDMQTLLETVRGILDETL